jgi:glycosyltransferase involved in cell wall biosynthesis
MALEITLFVLYVFIGPLLWILFSVGAASSRRRMIMFEKFKESLPEAPPHVTIIIPAKDEGARITQCLYSALAQDYPNFDVLAVDDRSIDSTGKVMDELAASNLKLKALHIDLLPPGWTGKNNALYRAASTATGSWLLFIDSDVILSPTALSSALAVAAGREYDLLSLCLRHETPGVAEEVLVPLASTAIGAAYMMGLSNSESNSYFFANGQFMLFDKKAYDKIGGHEAVRNQYNEDMILAKIMKQAGLRPRIAWGAHLGSVRMYDSLATIMRGWSRIFFGSSAGSPWRSIGAILFILVGCYPLYGAAAWGFYRVAHPIGICNGYAWVIASFAHWLVMTIQIAIIYRWMGNRGIYALLFPISAIFLLAILARAVWMCLTKKVQWRGTTYSHQIELANPARP